MSDPSIFFQCLGSDEQSQIWEKLQTERKTAFLPNLPHWEQCKAHKLPDTVRVAKLASLQSSEMTHAASKILI